jgi:hypothetical protein
MFQLPSLAGDALAPLPAALPSCTGPPSLGAPCTARHVEHSQRRRRRPCSVPCNGLLRRDRAGHAAAEADGRLRSSPSSEIAASRREVAASGLDAHTRTVVPGAGDVEKQFKGTDVDCPCPIPWGLRTRSLRLPLSRSYRATQRRPRPWPTPAHTCPNLPKSPVRPNTFCSLVCPSNLPLWAQIAFAAASQALPSVRTRRRPIFSKRRVPSNSVKTLPIACRKLGLHALARAA